MSPRRGQSRSTWPIALLAMLALLVQSLIPAAAMARDGVQGGQSIVICTAEGAKTVSVGGEKEKPKGFGGYACYQCVVAALATTTPPDVTIAPALYAVRLEPAPRAALRGPAMARAPPRPPSQGPPDFPIA
ncbi:MAG: DUF2946 family protein [Caulobacter sp.]|nr:DUF2946 family protein [Caulobacter sp.]